MPDAPTDEPGMIGRPTGGRAGGRAGGPTGGPAARRALSIPVDARLRTRVDDLVEVLAAAGLDPLPAAEDLVGEVSGPRADPGRIASLLAAIAVEADHTPAVSQAIEAVRAFVPQ